MRVFDVNELEDHITEVLQSVQETGETVAVTKGGEIIAHLVPAGTPSLIANPPAWITKSPADAQRSETVSAVDSLREAWTNFDRLIKELGIQWPEGVDAVKAVREVRREL